MVESTVECSCYGCTITRQRAGIQTPDRSAEPCNPAGACAGNGQCWTHSEWVDEGRSAARTINVSEQDRTD